MSVSRAYYAVIPASIRYHKDLSNGAKLLYGEITALCNEKGYCWATNQYFARLYTVDPRTITRWVKELVEAKTIKLGVNKEEGNRRQIYLLPDPMDKNVYTYRQKGPDPIDKNVVQNNTVNNTHTLSESPDLGFPLERLYAFFPDISIAPGSAEMICSAVGDSVVDRRAWDEVLDLYKGNYNPATNSWLPQKVGTLLNVFRKTRLRIEKEESNGTDRRHGSVHRKRTDAEVFAESADFYANYPQP